MDKFNLECDGYAIPFNEVVRLIEFLDWGNKYRVAFELLALTGARISELKNMGLSGLRGNILVWKTGKNQKGYRRVELPEWFIKELFYHLDNHNHPSKGFFDFDGGVLRHVLNKQIRPCLGGLWQQKRPCPTGRGALKYEYLLQVKGLRACYATLKFYNNFKKWGATLAVECTAAAMRHSSYKMTAGHYVVGNFARLDIEKYGGYEIKDIIKLASQRKLGEFF